MAEELTRGLTRAAADERRRALASLIVEACRSRLSGRREVSEDNGNTSAHSARSAGAARTGAAGALAAHVLARGDADVTTVIGAGVQGRFQLRSLAALRRLRQVWVYDSVQLRAEVFAREMTTELGLPVQVALSAAAAIRPADIVLVATWSRTPFIGRSMLRAGAHVTTLGPDEPGKAEVDADLIRSGVFVCDDRALAVELGALQGVGLGPDAVDAELGDVLSGAHPGRTSSDQVTIYGGVGLAFQDAIAAWHTYEAALSRGVGRHVDLLGEAT